MSVAKQDTIYLYIQPIRASISTLQPWEISSEHRQLQLTRCQSPRLKVKKTQLKIRDIMKINKEYKVYGSQLHFYNVVFQVRIKQPDLILLEEQTLSLQLKSQNKAYNYQTRKYHTTIDNFIKLAEDKENLVNQVTLQCQNNESKLVCKAIVSDASLSLHCLEEMFENKQKSDIKRNSSQLFKSDFFQTNASSVYEEESREKFQRTTKSFKNIQGKLIKRTKKKLLGVQRQLISNKSISDKQLPKYQGEGVLGDLNTSFYDESPKIRRISRLRRSVLIPREVLHDQQDQSQTISQYKKDIKGSFYNLVLLMGVIMIYLMMIPSKRV